MSDSPTVVDVERVEDMSQLKDYYRQLQSQNEHLKELIADDRQHLQQIEFKHRESVDKIAILQSQNVEMAKKLEKGGSNEIDNYDDFIDDEFDDVSSTSEQNTQEQRPKNKRDHEIEQLKDELEDLKLALAEERMLGMQLDFSNRQSAQRADILQYQLAEEKLKNMHLQSSHQNLTLGNDDSSGFVHLRDLNDGDKDVVDNKLIDDDNTNTNNNNNNNNNNTNENNNNNKSRGSNKKTKKKRKHKHDDDDDSTSDLSREFDLKIEEEPIDEDDVNVEEEARDLRHKLLEEQFKTEELKHRHRKSELQIMQYKEALDELRTKYEAPNGNYLDPESANAEAIQGGGGIETRNMNDAERLAYETEISQLKDQLEIAKKKTLSLDKQRRDSLNIMSKNFFAKQLQAARDTHSLEENLQNEIDVLKGQIYDVTKSKILLLQSTNETIDQLRSHIVELSFRLRKYENWDSNDNINDKDEYDVTDL